MVSALLDMSLKAGVVIGAVLFLRLLLKGAPRVWSYALWSVVLFRLLCPVSFESDLSVLRREVRFEVEEQTFAVYEAMEPGQAGEMVYHAVGDALNGGLDTIPVRLEPGYETALGNQSKYGFLFHDDVWFLVFCGLWPLGVLVMAGRGGLSLLVLKRKLRGAAYRGENVYEAEELETAFVMGLFFPRIYLPTGLGEEERACVLCHERHHIARLDHVTRALAFAALCLHWFNPLVWLAFRLAGKDMEMSCDEAVMKKLGGESRRVYSQSLLNLATGRRMAFGTPLAFGEGDTKGRIMNVMKWKKPKVWVSVLAMLVCAVGICACASDPKTPEDTPVQPTVEEPTQPAQEEPTQNSEFPNRRGLAFSELEQGQTVYLNEDVVLAGEGSRVEWQVTYARTGLTLQVGLRAHANGCEYVADVDGGTGTGIFEYVDPGIYTPFVRNVDLGYESEPNATGVVNFDLLLEGDYFQNATPWPEVEEETLRLPEGAQIIGDLPGNISLLPELYNAVLDHHRSEKSEGNFCCASIVVLDNYPGTRSHPITGEDDLAVMDYFLWVLYQEYQFTEEGIVDMGGSHLPVSIRMEENGDGSWSVRNYWVPRDGSYYVEDIRMCFPEDIVEEALDSQKYIMVQKQDCYAQAVAWAKVSANADLDVEAVISGLLDEICSSPMTSSSPQDYIDAHPIAYRELLYYGDYTRAYCHDHLQAYYEENHYGKGTVDAPEGEGLRERVMERLLGELSA